MAHTYTSLYYHIVFSTKNRAPLLTADWRDNLFGYLVGVGNHLKATTVEIGGVEDHVHWLCRAPAALAVAELVQKVKANSSGWANEERKIDGRFEWQIGYAAFSVSCSQAPRVKRYIATQEEHHRKEDYARELRRLLERHGIEFDERYLLD